MNDDLKFDKPIPDYDKAGFNDNLFKTDIYEEGSEGFTKNDFIPENRRKFKQAAQQSLNWELKGTTTITSADFQSSVGFGASRYRKTIKHNLGYYPLVIASVQLGGTEEFIPMPYSKLMGTSSSYDGFFGFNIWVTKTDCNFELFVETFSPTFPYTIKYYILRERINEAS